ncbi:MAG: carboxypeptidase-like regulatory domain-containing protein [bacterium]|nr:carboxypeptidase-like regulatory domain-containing protein [bacterium]
MKNGLRTLFCLLLMWGVARAQGAGRMEGLVTDAYARPFPGVSIQLSGEGILRRTATAEDGRFEFDAVPSGTYTLTAISVGYKTAIYRNIQVADGSVVSHSVLMQVE